MVIDDEVVVIRILVELAYYYKLSVIRQQSDYSA